MFSEEIRESEGGDHEILRGELLEFLNEFEASDETQEAMKAILRIWHEEILNHAKKVGGGTFKAIKTFMNVCDDYANNRGMLERVKQEAEEARLHLDL